MYAGDIESCEMGTPCSSMRTLLSILTTHYSLCQDRITCSTHTPFSVSGHYYLFYQHCSVCIFRPFRLGLHWTVLSPCDWVGRTHQFHQAPFLARKSMHHLWLSVQFLTHFVSFLWQHEQAPTLHTQAGFRWRVCWWRQWFRPWYRRFIIKYKQPASEQNWSARGCGNGWQFSMLT